MYWRCAVSSTAAPAALPAKAPARGEQLPELVGLVAASSGLRCRRDLLEALEAGRGSRGIRCWSAAAIGSRRRCAGVRCVAAPRPGVHRGADHQHRPLTGLRSARTVRGDAVHRRSGPSKCQQTGCQGRPAVRAGLAGPVQWVVAEQITGFCDTAWIPAGGTRSAASTHRGLSNDRSLLEVRTRTVQRPPPSPSGLLASCRICCVRSVCAQIQSEGA